jgi:hypothetical protein
MKKTLLKLLFGAIFVTMVVMTVRTQANKSIMLSPNEFSWQTSPWACATLVDAYFGFITFYAWVWFKERSLASRILWFVLIMSLGNIAMSGYVLIQLFRLGESEPASAILTSRRGLLNS